MTSSPDQYRTPEGSAALARLRELGRAARKVVNLERYRRRYARIARAG